MPRTVRRAPAPRRKSTTAKSTKTRVSHTSESEHAHIHAHEAAAHATHHQIPRVLTADEKRQLILAHVEARRARPVPTLSFSYYATVAAAVMIVAAGWWFTLGKNLRAGQAPANVPDPVIQIVQQTTQRFASQYQESSQEYQAIQADQKNAKEQQLQQAIIQKTAQEINQRTSSTPDLYHP